VEFAAITTIIMHYNIGVSLIVALLVGAVVADNVYTIGYKNSDCTGEVLLATFLYQTDFIAFNDNENITYYTNGTTIFSMECKQYATFIGCGVSVFAAAAPGVCSYSAEEGLYEIITLGLTDPEISIDGASQINIDYYSNTTCDAVKRVKQYIKLNYCFNPTAGPSYPPSYSTYAPGNPGQTHNYICTDTACKDCSIFGNGDFDRLVGDCKYDSIFGNMFSNEVFGVDSTSGGVSGQIFAGFLWVFVTTFGLIL